MAERFAGRRVLALGGDGADRVGRLFASEGAETRRARLSEPGGRPRATDDVVSLDAASLVRSRLFRDASIVVAALSDERLSELFAALASADLSREPARPIVVSAGDAAGFLRRSPADVVCLADRREADRYALLMAENGGDATNAAIFGPPSAPADPEALFAQCLALLGGQDRLGAALPLRPIITAPEKKPGLVGRLFGRL